MMSGVYFFFREDLTFTNETFYNIASYIRLAKWLFTHFEELFTVVYTVKIHCGLIFGIWNIWFMGVMQYEDDVQQS